MALITVEIPDDLALKLENQPNQLQTIIALGLSKISPSGSGLYAEVVDFLSKGPTAAEISQFKPSPESEERIRHLLDKNRQGLLAVGEMAELDQIQALNHLMTLIKTRARKA